MYRGLGELRVGADSRGYSPVIRHAGGDGECQNGDHLDEQDDDKLISSTATGTGRPSSSRKLPPDYRLVSGRVGLFPRAGGAARASYRRGGQPGLTPIAGSDRDLQAFAASHIFRRSRLQPNWALSRGSGTDGLLRRRARRELQWQADARGEHQETPI
jgi:hypothetical protein